MPKLRKVNLSEIRPYKNNAKIHPKAQIEKLKKSFLKFGVVNEIGLDEKNIIVFGHGRYYALQELVQEGHKEFEKQSVKDMSYLTAKERKEYRVFDNKSASTEYDDNKLQADIDSMYKGIVTPAMLMDNLGLSKKEVGRFIPAIETKGDDDLKVKVQAVTKLGDLWELGKHRVMCADASEPENLKNLFGGELIELIFTDPPYGVSYSDKNKFLNNQDKGNCIQEPIENDHLEVKEVKDLWLKTFKAFIPYMASKSSYYICSPQGGDLFMMMMMIKESGLQLKHQIIWVKNNHVLGRSDYNYKHEPIFYGWYKKHAFYGNGQQKFSVWNYNKPLKSDLHPTMKPVDLVLNAIRNSTEGAGSVVYDCFLGSGSTLIAAEKSERICYGLELDPHYCDVIRDRYIKWCHDNGRTASVKLNGKDWSGK